ncbi:MAG TPA: potassium-transporting ATPase subunit KdpC [Steroidobacteraceae bacterium]|nr:potassium-transporting ATPase subunit KdpC [Steroidobacteraceae bacterium]
MRLLRPAISLLLVMTALLGIAYPLIITGLARAGFPRQAAGSLVFDGGKLIGSSLIGQSFSDPKYFWGRPSATAPQPYNALASSGSNFGPLNPALIEQAKASVKALHDASAGDQEPIPVDLVTASASGLDPDISLAAARYQAGRIARARHMPTDQVLKLIDDEQQGLLLGILGERRVNVLALNLALDRER